MPSPFPGMDPYLERPSLWPDVHLELMRAIRATLAPRVAPRYYVSVEERTYIATAEPFDIFKTYTPVGRPDVAVVDLHETRTAYSVGVTQMPSASPAGGLAAAALERPVIVQLPVADQIRERYLEVRDTATHEVITVIEILSPTNKRPGEGRQQYEKKRQQVLGSLTNLVEFDLLRDGQPMPISRLPASHYRILVSRAWERPRAYLYPFNLNEAIPEIPIPLRAGEAEPTLSLGDLLAQVYDQVRYDLRIDYAAEPEPPLDADTAAWVRALVDTRR
jgi:hypothetical protein